MLHIFNHPISKISIEKNEETFNFISVHSGSTHTCSGGQNEWPGLTKPGMITPNSISQNLFKKFPRINLNCIQKTRKIDTNINWMIEWSVQAFGVTTDIVLFFYILLFKSFSLLKLSIQYSKGISLFYFKLFCNLCSCSIFFYL